MSVVGDARYRQNVPSASLSGRFQHKLPFSVRTGNDLNWSAAAKIAVIPCFGLARQKLPYVQTLAGDGFWAVCGLAGFGMRGAIADRSQVRDKRGSVRFDQPAPRAR